MQGRQALRTVAAVFAACAATMSGCASQAKPAVVATPPPSGPAPVERSASVHAEIDQVAIDCAPHGQDTCNAIDDDCNGVIDDGCGYATGGVQVTIAWDTGADIDLYVVDPSGQAVYYNEEHRKSPLGGQMDHDARGDCRREQQNPRIENAFWPSPAPSGTYEIDLHYFGPCGDISKTHVTVSVAALGKPFGTFRYELQPEERVKALSLVVP
jgi:hypothetical protein